MKIVHGHRNSVQQNKWLWLLGLIRMPNRHNRELAVIRESYIEKTSVGSFV